MAGSKILLPGNCGSAAPLVWKQVPPSGQSSVSEEESPGGLDSRVAQLEQQWEMRVREAHAAGLREGESTGRSRAAAEMQAVVARLAATIDELAGARAQLRRQAESDVVQLSLAIARRILRREMAVDADALRGVVVAALEKMPTQEGCRVRVHPSHAHAISEYLRNSGRTSSPIEVLPDAGREPGTVIFETERGNLDASIDSQLAEIERGLTDRLRKQS